MPHPISIQSRKGQDFPAVSGAGASQFGSSDCSGSEPSPPASSELVSASEPRLGSRHEGLLTSLVASLAVSVGMSDSGESGEKAKFS